MKILFFSAFYHPHLGGVEMYVHNIAKRLNPKHQITVVTCNTEKVNSKEVVDGVRIIRLDSWSILGGRYPIPRYNKQNRRTIANLAAEPWDLVNTHTRFFITSILGARFAKRNRLVLVHTEHGSRHTDLASHYLTWVATLFDHTIGAWVIKQSTLVIGISKACLNFVAHLGIKNKPTALVYNGVDTKRFLQSPARFDRLIFVGRLIKAKGLDDLIAIWPDIVSAFPEATLIIAGDGVHRQSLEKQSQNIPSINYLGSVKPAVVTKMLNEGGIFINPSHSEGLPTTVLEAGAAGMPVIATNVGGTDEIIDTDTGYLIEPGNQETLRHTILDVMTKKSNDQGLRLREKVQSKFEWDNIARSFERTITEKIQS